MSRFFSFALGLAFLCAFFTPLRAAETPVFFLENIDLEEVQDSAAETVILHYSRDGTGREPFTIEEIDSVQASGKLVLAYLPVAEAEVFEFYWNPEWETVTETAPCYETYYSFHRHRFEWRRCDEVRKPSWLGPKNPENGKYFVRYWQQGWWDTALKPYLEKINSAGFDGVYVDFGEAERFWRGNYEERYSKNYLKFVNEKSLQKIKNYAAILPKDL